MEQFYVKHISQSDYRKERESGTANKDSVIDTHLDNLNIKDADIKKGLVQKIKDEILKIIMVVMPEDKWDEIINGTYLGTVLNKLGL